MTFICSLLEASPHGEASTSQGIRRSLRSFHSLGLLLPWTHSFSSSKPLLTARLRRARGSAGPFARFTRSDCSSPGPLSGCVRQERHLPCVLDRRRHVTLVLGAVARHPACADLPPVRDELAEQGQVLVVDEGDLVLAEDADLLLLLLPGLLFLFSACFASFLSHPAASPPVDHRPQRTPGCSSRSGQPPVPGARPSRSPTSGWGRSPRLRSRSWSASRPRGSPTS